MSATCPVCEREQDEGLLCHACTSTLEYELGDVPAILLELDVTLSRQGRIGSGGKGGLASEKNPVHLGALAVAGDLANTLITWARDISNETWWPREEEMAVQGGRTKAAAWLLLSEIPAIRKHPAVDEIVDEVTDAIRRVRQVVDRPADLQFVGPCLAEHEGVACTEELYARPRAGTVRCKVCGSEHDVVERRAWLLAEAKDVICTVKEASRYMGAVGHITVTEASIRGYLHRGKIGYKTDKMIRLGDLMAVVLDDGERRSA